LKSLRSPSCLATSCSAVSQGNDDPVSLLQAAVHLRAGLDDFAHHFVPDIISRLHLWDENMEEMGVPSRKSANRAARHFDERITGMLDFRVRYRVASDVFLAMPDARRMSAR
jgi:hypothetical protein